LKIPHYIFLPLILLVATIGSYSVSNSIIDVFSLLLLGVVGYILRKLDFQLAPMVVGMVLGPLIEKHMREALIMSQGDTSVFYSTPIAVGLWILVALVMSASLLRKLLARLFVWKTSKVHLETQE
jgi:putative tricarboxylic transport membrane protein